MGRVRNKDTKPKMKVRRLVHSMEYRYRLHSGGLPGRPDIVFPERRKIIFVHGCYWHRHEGCSRCRLPKSRLDFWAQAREEQVARHQESGQTQGVGLGRAGGMGV